MIKKFSFLMAFISLMLLGVVTCSSSPYELEKDSGSFYPLKTPTIEADVYFDYSDCIVNRKTSLYGPDAAGDGLAEQIISELKGGEVHFIKWFNQEYGNKYCKLNPEGNNAPYKIEIKAKFIQRNETTVLGSKSRIITMGCNAFVIDKATSDTIAIGKFVVMGNKTKATNDPEFDFLTEVMYEDLASDLAKKIKKAKAPKK